MEIKAFLLIYRRQLRLATIIVYFPRYCHCKEVIFVQAVFQVDAYFFEVVSSLRKY